MRNLATNDLRRNVTPLPLLSEPRYVFFPGRRKIPAAEASRQMDAALKHARSVIWSLVPGACTLACFASLDVIIFCQLLSI